MTSTRWQHSIGGGRDFFFFGAISLFLGRATRARDCCFGSSTSAKRNGCKDGGEGGGEEEFLVRDVDLIVDG